MPRPILYLTQELDARPINCRIPSGEFRNQTVTDKTTPSICRRPLRRASEAQAFPDGTKDYIPLRSGAPKATANKVHIADTPMTWKNMHQHINWLNTTLVVIVPMIGFVSAYWVPLQLKTAIFAAIYYFNTGLGITAGELESLFRALFNYE
ncbi:hypothetical protein NM208_g16306 [Fusarium decemcellulare]|uniref:Uncharacterized protein n=1 Tax=Fusarium decemcellulare TaxID=57161 RepID=A0ACC1RCF2_9HYPO|nr:hypothetical protein NM208_g16306 [Fusarium decemcellulare]